MAQEVVTPMRANRNAAAGPPALTLHQGGGRRSFTEHPTETCRKALLAAAAVEDAIDPIVANHMRRFAHTLPDRSPVVRSGR
jgi:hypothetical protein